MDQNYPFVRDDVLPSFWANRIQDFVASLGRFRLRQATANSIEVPAGPEDDAVSLSIERRWRFVEATVARAHPGGAAGTYDVYVTAAENDVSNAPAPFTDNTDYSFDLAIVADGATPAIVPGTVDIFRLVGTLQWSGAAITQVTPLVGAQPDAHAASHAVGGSDPLTPAAIGAATTAALATEITDRVADVDAEQAARIAADAGKQAASVALDEWAAKARPAGVVVGTSDAQTLTNKTLTDAKINGRRVGMVVKSADYTVTAADEVIFASVGAPFTITLPDADTVPGKIVTIEKRDSTANQVTITRDPATSDLINDVTSFGLRSQFAAVTLTSDGSNWFVIDQFPGLPGTSLPTAGFNGQEFIYAADVANGISYRLVYRAAEATYKWLAPDAADLSAEVETAETLTTAGSWQDIAGGTAGPQVTLPLGGDYDITWGATCYPSAGTTNIVSMGVRRGASDPANGSTGAWIASHRAPANCWSSIERTQRLTGVAAGTVIKARYRCDVVNGIFISRFVTAKAIRVV